MVKAFTYHILESNLEGWHREIKELTTLGNVAQVIYKNIYIHLFMVSTCTSHILEADLEGWHREIKELTTLGNVAQVL